jgi:DNA mismatch endonuclease (patch repair protein)
MSKVRSRDTGPEIRVRRLLFGLGFRYRVHYPKLPGRPDIVFRGRRKVVFVHGCFWHQHRNCPNSAMPKSNVAFWREKLKGNRLRDARHHRELSRRGWKSLVLWECQLDATDSLKKTLIRFLDGDS